MTICTTHNRHTESGNILVYILIAVILFAALSYAFTQSTGGTTTSTLEGSKMRVQASQLIDYTSDIKKSVSEMKILNDCEATDISFDYGSNDWGEDYSHGSSDSCKVFNTAGGGMSYKDPQSEWLNSGATKEWAFNQVAVDDVGSGKNELLMHLRDVREPLCRQLNQELDVNDGGAPPTGSNDITVNFFTNGTFGSGSPAGITGQKAGCVEQSGTFYFYKVLIAQ